LTFLVVVLNIQVKTAKLTPLLPSNSPHPPKISLLALPGVHLQLTPINYAQQIFSPPWEGAPSAPLATPMVLYYNTKLTVLCPNSLLCCKQTWTRNELELCINLFQHTWLLSVTLMKPNLIKLPSKLIYQPNIIKILQLLTAHRPTHWKIWIAASIRKILFQSWTFVQSNTRRFHQW